MSTQTNVQWLWHLTEQYRSITNDMCEAIEDFDEVEKLGHSFSLADPLEEIDIGDGTTPRPTFVNKNMSLEHKYSIIKLLRNYIDCFAWNYREMSGLSRELVEHRLPIKTGFMPYKEPARKFNSLFMIGLRRRWSDYSTRDSFDLADTWSGFPTLYPWRRRTLTKFRYV
jgi:hypothetical protein